MKYQFDQVHVFVKNAQAQLPVLGTGEEKKPFSARLKQIKEMIRSKKESQAEALRPVVTRAGSEVDVKLDLSATDLIGLARRHFIQEANSDDLQYDYFELENMDANFLLKAAVTQSQSGTESDIAVDKQSDHSDEESSLPDDDNKAKKHNVLCDACEQVEVLDVLPPKVVASNIPEEDIVINSNRTRRVNKALGFCLSIMGVTLAKQEEGEENSYYGPDDETFPTYIESPPVHKKEKKTRQPLNIASKLRKFNRSAGKGFRNFLVKAFCIYVPKEEDEEYVY